MERRRLGRTGIEVGIIGLGTEHLEPEPENIDRVLAMAVEAGANYVDLLYTEPEYWEQFGAVYSRHRDQLVVAPHWWDLYDGDLDACHRGFENTLAKGCGGHAEVAMMTMIDKPKQWRDWGLPSIEILQGMRDRGQIEAIGMSSHSPETTLLALEAGLVDVLMYGVNMVTHGEAQHAAVLDACRRLDVGVVAMKPFWGGPLLTLDGKATGITPSQCLRYTLEQPVATTVPGVRNPEQMRATLAYLDASLAEKDYSRALAGLRDTLQGHCTYCNHCMPCPEGIDVGQTILVVDWSSQGVNEELRGMYADLPEPARSCVACAICMERCPFGVDVIAKMERAVALFETR